jgi:hypothetical protein
MVRLMSCGFRECRQAAIDKREREREGTDRDITNKKRREEHRSKYSITKHVPPA